jgi:hypothetical protein
MTGAVRGRRLRSHRAEVALRPRGPAHRRSDARARPAPVAAAPPRAADVRPPADPACRHTCASRRGPCHGPRRVARRRAARADPGVLTLKPGWTAASIRQTDASASHGRRRPWVADRTCVLAIALVRCPRCRPSPRRHRHREICDGGRVKHSSASASACLMMGGSRSATLRLPTIASMFGRVDRLLAQGAAVRV